MALNVAEIMRFLREVAQNPHLREDEKVSIVREYRTLIPWSALMGVQPVAATILRSLFERVIEQHTPASSGAPAAFSQGTGGEEDTPQGGPPDPTDTLDQGTAGLQSVPGAHSYASTRISPRQGQHGAEKPPCGR